VSPTRRVLALAALVAAALPPAPAVALAGGRRSPALRFAAAYDAAEAADDAAAERRFRGLGNLLDGLIVARLDASSSVARAAEILPALRGYVAASQAAGKAGDPLLRGPWEGLPSYRLAPWSSAGAERAIGLFDFAGHPGTGDEGRGHLAVYTRTAAGWKTTGAFDSSFRLAAACLERAGVCAELVTVETFLGADRYEGTLRTWSLAGGHLRAGRVWQRLIDYDLARRGGGVAISYDVLLPHLLGTIAEPRIRYELTLAAGADGVAATRRSLNPWVEAIDRDYLASPLRKAAHVGAEDPCCDPCAGRPIMRSAQGDLAAGAGQATIEDGGVSWCVEARRTRRGAWRIAKVTPGPLAGTER
jgi:hypothetical protein